MAPRNAPPRDCVHFEYIDQARRDAGFLIVEACRELGISEQTWRRWRKHKKAPKWAYKCLSLLSGDLQFLGWKHWVIRGGVLYEKSLNARYHSWTPEDLLLPLFNITRGTKPRLRVIESSKRTDLDV